jgi:hypothetical protein
MKTLHSAIIGLTLLAGAPVAHADVVTDWSQTAIEVMKTANVAGNPWTRSMAMMHVAMSDAVNTVQGRYTRFIATGPAAPGASAEAAASAAAREMLLQLYPAQQAKIDEAYALSLKSVPEGAARNSGVAVGKQVAAVVFADRSNDATNVPDTYRPVATPGVWIPTTPPLFPQYAQAKPWGLRSADQIRPGPPPALSSALYARDFNETKELGAMKSARRTPEQAEAVRFWTQANFTPSWFQVASQLSAQKGLGLADNARLFALLAMGVGNCFITEWDAKYHYNFWRPITAIRNGDMDGNDATERDAGWTPLNATPMHPEYPSAAGILAGAAVGVLQAVFGNGPASFTVTDLFDPKLQRQFTSVAQMGKEQYEIRIWGGIHFRNSLEVGDAMGRKIADQLVSNYLKPTQRTADASR